MVIVGLLVEIVRNRSLDFTEIEQYSDTDLIVVFEKYYDKIEMVVER